MRPFKHVASDTPASDGFRYQNILRIDIARFAAPWGEVPIVATTELDRTTLYHWNDLERHWVALERAHETLTFSGDTTESPTSWNWSDRVAIACSNTTVYVVSKRRHTDGPIGITIERYQPAQDQTPPNHSLNPIDVNVLASEAPFGINQVGQEIGRSLWAGCNQTGDLLVLFQKRTKTSLFDRSSWNLVVARVRFDPQGSMTKQIETVGEGGFDLDATLDGNRILAVYRKTSEAFRIPMIFLIGQGTTLTSQDDADPFYEQLQLSTINTASLSTQTETIPGGEHPQIQRTSPLLITMDRPSTLALALDTPILPLPPRRPHAIWNEGAMDKVAWLRDGPEEFRGTLLTADANAIPRSHAMMSQSTHLFENRDGLLVHAAPFANFPVHVLAISRDSKGLVLDLLHHRELLGLYRTRLHATLSGGALTVNDRAFEVWDIGHGQIGDPDDTVPSADAENTQFTPTGSLSVSAATNVNIRRRLVDNTIGGHLAAETSREPVGFFAYSDLGDGCLRVIFANDIPAPGDPPPIESDKILRPEQVTGPHLACDVWIQLEAARFVRSELIGYSVGLGHTKRSLGSALEVPIDFLLDAITIVNGDDCSAGDPPLDPIAGVNSMQLTTVDSFRVKQLPPLTIPLNLDDGRAVTVNVTFHDTQNRCPDTPFGALVQNLSANLSVDLGGNAPAALWTLTPEAFATQFLPDGPVLPQTGGNFPIPQTIAAGNPATIIAPAAARWRLSVFITDEGTPFPGAAADVDIQESTYEMLRSLYRGAARGEYHRIGNLDAGVLQYSIKYAAVDGGAPSLIAVVPEPERATELRFRRSPLGQGFVDSAAILTFSTDQLKLRYNLDQLFNVKHFELKLHYGRPFTPGMLMSDVRSRDPLDGHLFPDGGGFDEVERRDARKHAAIGAKPCDDARIYRHSVDVDVEMTVFAVGIPAILAALAVMGAFAIAQIIVAMTAAAATASVIGIIGIVAAPVALIAVWIFIAVVVPPIVEDFIREKVGEHVESPEFIELLNNEALARYSGEGAAESIARKVLAEARRQGFNVPAPAELDSDAAGRDRFYGQLFQMVFVSDGICRVLIRLDDCHDQIGLPPTPPGGDDGDDGPPLVTPGGG